VLPPLIFFRKIKKNSSAEKINRKENLERKKNSRFRKIKVTAQQNKTKVLFCFQRGKREERERL